MDKDPSLDWEIQDYYSSSASFEADQENDEKSSLISWVISRGLSLGKKLFITGVVVSSAPVVIPPLIVVSALGVAFSVPFGFVFASYACTQKFMSNLLPEASMIEDYPHPIEEMDEEEMDEAAMFGADDENDKEIMDGTEVFSTDEEVNRTLEAEKLASAEMDNKVDDEQGNEDDELLRDSMLLKMEEIGLIEPRSQEDLIEKPADEGRSSEGIIEKAAIEGHPVEDITNEGRLGEAITEESTDQGPFGETISEKPADEGHSWDVINEEPGPFGESISEKPADEGHSWDVIIEEPAQSRSRDIIIENPAYDGHSGEDIIIEKPADEGRSSDVTSEKPADEGGSQEDTIIEKLVDEGHLGEDISGSQADEGHLADIISKKPADVGHSGEDHLMETPDDPEILEEQTVAAETHKRKKVVLALPAKQIQVDDIEDRNAEVDRMVGPEVVQVTNTVVLTNKDSKNDIGMTGKGSSSKESTERKGKKKTGTKTMKVSGGNSKGRERSNNRTHESVAGKEKESFEETKTSTGHNSNLGQVIITDEKDGSRQEPSPRIIPTEKTKITNEKQDKSNKKQKADPSRHKMNESSQNEASADFIVETCILPAVKDESVDSRGSLVEENANPTDLEGPMIKDVEPDQEIKSATHVLPDENIKESYGQRDVSKHSLEVPASVGLTEMEHQVEAKLKVNNAAFEADSGLHSDEAMIHDEEIWKQIDAIRMIVGFKVPRHISYFEELRALYLFTGIEPPSGYGDARAPHDIAEFYDKLRFLMAVIGVK